MFKARFDHHEAVTQMLDVHSGAIEPLAQNDRIVTVAAAVLYWGARDMHPTDFGLEVASTPVQEIGEHYGLLKSAQRAQRRKLDKTSCYQIALQEGVVTFVDETHMPLHLRNDGALDRIVRINPHLETANLTFGGMNTKNGNKVRGFDIAAYSQITADALENRKLPKEYGIPIFTRLIKLLGEGASYVTVNNVIDEFQHKTPRGKVPYARNPLRSRS